MEKDLINEVTDFCYSIFKEENEYELLNEYNYSHLPLCVIDAVFSIGVKYETVQNTVNRFCDYFNIDKFSVSNELTTTDFLALMEQYSLEYLTNKIFQNRQRTSPKGGILKSEAVILFLKILKKFNIDKLSDTDKIIDNILFEKRIKEIKGQKSGISLKYFFMLCGYEDYVKPDRMITRFLEKFTNQKLSLSDCEYILKKVSQKLIRKGLNLSPTKLDNLIWNYQRIQKNNLNFKNVSNMKMSIYDSLKEAMKSKEIGTILKTREIKEEMKIKFSINPSSVIPSDYCYNRYNYGIGFDKHIFEFCERNKYKYLGENYPYTGKVYHKPQGKNEEIEVGEWINGKLMMKLY